MPRGGKREGAGRKATNPKTIAKKAARKGLTAPDGTKTADAGKAWPFGREAVPPAAPPVEEPKLSFKTPIEFWEHILADPGASVSAKQSAAYSLAPYVHPKLAPLGKKEEKDKAAKNVASKFAPTAAPPRLVAAGGKKV